MTEPQEMIFLPLSSASPLGNYRLVSRPHAILIGSPPQETWCGSRRDSHQTASSSGSSAFSVFAPSSRDESSKVFQSCLLAIRLHHPRPEVGPSSLPPPELFLG